MLTRLSKISLVAALGLYLLIVVFNTVGGEWFLMWQSSAWNGVSPAARMFTVAGLILIFLHLRDGELEP